MCYQSGKGVGRMVPVTIPQDVEPALHLLADQQLRKQVTVHPKNMYLFPWKITAKIKLVDGIPLIWYAKKLE